MERSQSVRGDSFFYIKFDVLNLLSNIMKKIYLAHPINQGENSLIL